MINKQLQKRYMIMSYWQSLHNTWALLYGKEGVRWDKIPFSKECLEKHPWLKECKGITYTYAESCLYVFKFSDGTFMMNKGRSPAHAYIKWALTPQSKRFSPIALKEELKNWSKDELQ